MKHATFLLALPLVLAACSGTPVSAYKDKGDTYFEAGQNQTAIEAYEQYMQLRPGDEAARFNLATAYTRTGEHAKAAEHLRILHTQVPNRPDYTDALAESLLAADRKDELYRLLKSEALEQQTMTDWLRLGRFALRQGDKDTALVALLAAARVDGGRSHEPHIELYDYYRSMGMRPEAVRRLRMAAFVSPRNAEVTRRIAESGEISGPTFPIRPDEWDARAFDGPSFDPFGAMEPRTGSTSPVGTPPSPAPAGTPASGG